MAQLSVDASADQLEAAMNAAYGHDMKAFNALQATLSQRRLDDALAEAHRVRDSDAFIANSGMTAMLAPLALPVGAAGLEIATGAAATIAESGAEAVSSYAEAVQSAGELIKAAVFRNGVLTATNLLLAAKIAASTPELAQPVEALVSMILAGDAGVALSPASVAVEAEEALPVEIHTAAPGAAAFTQIGARRVMSRAEGYLVGISRRQFRRAAAAIIRDDPEHDLRPLLDANLSFRPTTLAGMTMQTWIENPLLVEAGHAVSNHFGGPEVLIMMSAWKNRWISATVESPGLHMQVSEAVVIGNIAVDIDLARDLVTANLSRLRCSSRRLESASNSPLTAFVTGSTGTHAAPACAALSVRPIRGGQELARALATKRNLPDGRKGHSRGD